MIILNPNRITGKQLHKIIMRAVKERNTEYLKRHPRARPVTKAAFYRVSGLSKQHANRMVRGVSKPGPFTLQKVAYGLERWGHRVEIKKLVIRT